MSFLLTRGLGGGPLTLHGLLPTTKAEIRRALVATLLAEPGIAAVFGARIYPLTVPESAAYPALTYQFVSLPRPRTLDGSDGTARARVQFGVVSRDYADCEAGAEALRQVFDQFEPPVIADFTVSESSLVNETDHHEPPPDGSDRWVYRTVCEYVILYYEPAPAPAG